MGAVLHAGASRLNPGAGVFEGTLSLTLLALAGLATYVTVALWLRLEPVPEVSARLLAALRRRYLTVTEAFR